MKRIVIVAIGTHGDVRPVIALSDILKNGYRITVIAPPENRRFFMGSGTEFLPIGDNFRDVAAKSDLNYYRDQVRLQFREHLDLYKNADIIIGAGLFFAGKTIAEYFSKAYFHIFYTPQVLKSNAITPPSAKKISHNRFLNRLLWKKHCIETDVIYKNLVNMERIRLGLKPVNKIYDDFIDVPVILGFDAFIAGIPDAYKGNVTQCNYWYYEDKSSIDENVQEFLSVDPAPVLIHLGTIERLLPDSGFVYETIYKSIKSQNRRALFISNLDFSLKNDNNILVKDYLPFSSVLSRCSVILHHGGLGTFYTALKAGIPQIIFPFAFDQFYWAAKAKEFGVGSVISDVRKNIAAQITCCLENIETHGEIHRNCAMYSKMLNSKEKNAEIIRNIKSVLHGV